MKRAVILFFILRFSIFALDKYIPKSNQEKLYLEELKNKTITVGFLEKEYTDLGSNNKNLDDTMLEIFKNYLGLNIKVVKKDDEKLLNDLKNGKIDVIGYLKRDGEKREYCEFSNKIYLENMYITSKNIKIDGLNDLENKTIYIDKDNTFYEELENFLKKEGVNAKIERVEDVRKYYKNNLIFVSGLYVNGKGNKIIVAKTAGTSIGVSKKYKDLVPILNNILFEKYEEKIIEIIANHKKNVQLEDFNKLLTDKEKKYLKFHKNVTIGVEKKSVISKKKGEAYIGIMPDILSKISSISGMKFIYLTSKDDSWSSLKKMFKEDKVQILISSINDIALSKNISSDKIFDLKICFITKNSIHSDKIGVEKDSVDEYIAKKYFFPENIIKFNSKSEVINALLNNKISYAILPQMEGFSNEYMIEDLETVPINLIFHQNDKILRDIFNKALKVIGKYEIEQILVLNHLQERNELFLKDDEIKKLQRLLIFIVAFVIILLVLALIYKININKKLSKNLRTDFLTGLKNRVSFNELCNERNDIEGVAILIDLNNFKRANDNFGHDVGDLIIVEVAKIIKKVFKNDYNFRISGDEFYSFISKNNYLEKIIKLKEESENSELLNRYNVSFALGYYVKSKKINLEKSFKYADTAMYKAKEKGGYSIVEATEDMLN